MAEDLPLSPVPEDPAGVAALIQASLSAAAGEGVRPVSLSLDFGPACGAARARSPAAGRDSPARLRLRRRRLRDIRRAASGRGFWKGLLASVLFQALSSL